MNLGFPEMMFLFLVALLIFGPKKLPEIGRQVGKAMSEFKRATNDFKAQLDSEVRHLELEEMGHRIMPDGEAELIPASPDGTISTTAGYAVAGAVETAVAHTEPGVPISNAATSTVNSSHESATSTHTSAQDA
jgi:sec-independent protein translocase protein TatB